MNGIQLYTTPLDGKQVLLIEGDRLKRHSLPVKYGVTDWPPEKECFLCHEPTREIKWEEVGDGEAVTILNNSHPISNHGVTIWVRGHHYTSIVDLPPCALGGLVVWTALHKPPKGLAISFANVGVLGGHSHRHPHTQVVSFPELNSLVHDTARMSEAWKQSELPEVALEYRSLTIRIPAKPALTCEAWLQPNASFEELKEDPDLRRDFGADLRSLLRGVRSKLTDSMNMSFLSISLNGQEMEFIRVIPRGLSEPSGAEYTLPVVFSFVIATPELAHELWAEIIQVAQIER
jgi:hypothetical protein